MIYLSKPVFSREMEEAAVNALRNEFFVLGESVFRFEEEFAKYCGTKHAVSVSSGTNALHLSLLALGLKQGEKVLTTTMSFIASANAVIHAGGRPVFSDIDKTTGNIHPEKKDMKGVRGIIPVHLYGNPCDMDSIRHVSEKGMFIVEDACQAHGAIYRGKKTGSLGDVGCFSFYSVKNMTVGGDGGMITTDNEELCEKIKKLRDCGRVSKYEHDVVGYTARLNTVNAAIGRVQLKHLDEWNERRREIAVLYRKLLPKECVLETTKGSSPVYYMFVIKAKNRDGLMDHLKNSGIITGIHFPVPIHLQPVYRRMYGYREGDYPEAERFSREILSLPVYPELKNDEIKTVCEKANEVIEC